TLAARHGCRVTVLDLTESYVRAGEVLTERLHLSDRVDHRVGDALALPFPAGAFDMVWTQNSGMNIPDKERLYAGFHRVLRPGGVRCCRRGMRRKRGRTLPREGAALRGVPRVSAPGGRARFPGAEGGPGRPADP